MKKNDYWDVFKNNSCKNKVVLTAVLVTAVLCFGFAVTNHSIGIDDPLRNYYLYSNGPGSMIQQGRILHVVLNGLLGIVDFLPFFNEFLGAGLFALSALFFAALFQYISDHRFSNLSIVAFCCIYISYSVITEKFIYSLDVLVTTLSYCCTALSLMYSYRFVEERSAMSFVKAVAMMVLAAGSYESFFFLYFCGVFVIFLLQNLYNESKMTLKVFFVKGLKYALVLVCAAAIYYSAVFLIQIISGQYGVWERSTPWSSGDGVVHAFIITTKTIIKGMITSTYLPTVEFMVAALIGLVFFIYKSIKKKSLIPILCFGALFSGNFFIFYFVGYVLQRAAQTFCLFVAFIAFLIITEFEKGKFIKKVSMVLLVCLVLVQAADMNRAFYNDYQRYRKESYAIDAIATRLIADCDVSKPVVFVGTPEDGYLNNYEGPFARCNGLSMIYWGTEAFKEGKLHDVFYAYGYEFLNKPSQEDMTNAIESAEDMGVWPKENSIKEFDNYIVVKFA